MLTIIQNNFECVFKNNYFFHELLICSCLILIENNSDPKSGDARASIGYLFQQLTEDYDKKEKHEKTRIQTASHTGFSGRYFILDQYHQLDLQSMKWVLKDDLGKSHCV